MLCLPAGIASTAARIFEKIMTAQGKTPYFTPYAVDVLASKARFSREDAERELGYVTRPLKESVRDMVRWIELCADRKGKGGKNCFRPCDAAISG